MTGETLTPEQRLREECGASARSVVGMAVLPFGISVEIEGIFEVTP